MKYFQPIILIFFIILTLGILPTVQSQVKNEEITVIAPYEPSLSDAHKININPTISEKDIESPDLKYNVSPKLMPTFFEPVKITPVRLAGEPLTKLYQSYIKAGFGNYTTPYAELFYNNLRSRTTNLGVNYKHYSSNGKIKDYAPASFSDNILNAYASYFTASHIFNTDLLYKRNAFHYYGFKPNELNLTVNDSLKKATLQKYQTIGASASVKSHYTDKSKLHHQADLKFYTLKNAKTVENAFGITAYLSKEIDLISKIDEEKIKLDAGANIFNNPEFSVMKTGAVYFVKPQISFLTNQYALNIGLNASIEASDDSYIHFFPIIEGHIAIAKDVLALYGSFTGGMERNNIHGLFEENPFITSQFDSLLFTKNKINFKGGMKGNIASVFSFNIGAGFRESENMPFFVTDTAETFNQFNVVYDDVQIVQVYADFSFQATEKFMLMLRGDFNHYTMGTEKAPWHKPQIKGSILASYKLVDKINIKAEVYGQDKTQARLFDNNSLIYTRDIKPFADANLSVEYIYNKKISAFLNLNNLGGTRYYQWYSHPSQKFHLLAGMTYAF